MDIRMPGMDGLAATRAIMREPSPPRVLILTTFDSDEPVYQAMKAGASAVPDTCPGSTSEHRLRWSAP